ncbi:MAG: hypothetical protein HOP03_13265 [Lysobacter sp.]|nr:hypothetical protein [Lysobacter sp.]
MRLNTLRFAMLSLALTAANHPVKAATPVFASGYTDLSRDCRPAFADAELEEGQDNALRCKGSGEYGLFIYFSAMDAMLTVENARGDTVFDMPLTLDDYERGKVEWRLADGHAFAIIVRMKPKGAPETLEIRGIDSRRTIHRSVPVAGRKNANAQARTEADKAYVAGVR